MKRYRKMKKFLRLLPQSFTPRLSLKSYESVHDRPPEVLYSSDVLLAMEYVTHEEPAPVLCMSINTQRNAQETTFRFVKKDDACAYHVPAMS